jgi:hypothetical protein
MNGMFKKLIMPILVALSMAACGVHAGGHVGGAHAHVGGSVH